MADPRPTTIPAGAADDAAWEGLRRLTAARIGLPRSGASLATGAMLELRLAHARARDAVHALLDEERLRADLATLDWPLLAVSSAVRDRTQYLMRPDLGRQLAPDATTELASHAAGGHDVALVVTDGLSARAVERHGPPLLAALLRQLRMGAYLTWQPGPHTTDANRNCISNIRPQGIDPASAALKIMQLMRAMRARELSGVALKDETGRLLIDDSGARND